MNENKNEIVIFENQSIKLEVNVKDETVWLTAQQIADLFGRDVKTIRKHINNALTEELRDLLVVAKFASTKKYGRVEGFTQTKFENFYNLEMITSVGYRVKSKNGVLFRRWANNVLKDYLVKGYSINNKRIEALNKTVEIQNKMLSHTLNVDEEELSNVINNYTNALNLLDDYDHQSLPKIEKRKASCSLEYDECIKIINDMKKQFNTDIFGVEKEEGKLDGILKAIDQTMFGEDLYPSLEEKAAHLLYFLVKDHPFFDGCKRIGATLFLHYLNKNKVLFRENKLLISNDGLVAITLLTAESKPDEMEVIVYLIANLLKL